MQIVKIGGRDFETTGPIRINGKTLTSNRGAPSLGEYNAADA
ncbi:hypothetical protein [Ahrensia marina]|nr:hypothetical protein [Ahrensia marina]